jgi:hypothetical protein
MLPIGLIPGPVHTVICRVSKGIPWYQGISWFQMKYILVGVGTYQSRPLVYNKVTKRPTLRSQAIANCRDYWNEGNFYREQNHYDCQFFLIFRSTSFSSKIISVAWSKSRYSSCVTAFPSLWHCQVGKSLGVEVNNSICSMDRNITLSAISVNGSSVRFLLLQL